MFSIMYTATDSHYLWDNGDARPQVMKSYLRNVDSINVNFSFGSLQDPENSKG